MKKLFAMLTLLLSSTSVYAQTALPIPSGYPTLLGVSCGGVHVSSYLTGFNRLGNITGELYAWTRCGGSGRGGGYKTTTYQSWHSIVWGLDQSFIVTPYDGLFPDPLFYEVDQYGNQISNVCNGLTNGQPACVASATITYVPPTQVPVAPIAPSVVGMTQANASAAITAAGLTPSAYFTVTTAYPAGTVFYQTPAAGTQLTTGAVVSIGVAKTAPVDD